MSKTVGQPKPVPLSEWAQHAGRTVTRGECLNVVYLLIKRSLLLERQYQREMRWHRRLWRWLSAQVVQPEPVEGEGKSGAGASQGMTQEEADRYDYHDAEPAPEVPFKPTENGQVKFRDLRKRGDDA